MQFRQNFRPAIHASNDQGFALQTLIVTAVLVLMAIAAGVVTVAITNSSSDDLVDSQPDIAGPCKPWEIFDPILAAHEAGGGEKISIVYDISNPVSPYEGGDPVVSTGAGGIASSGIGCLAPCYLTLNDAHDLTLDLVLLGDTADRPPYEGQLPNLGGQAVSGPGAGDLKFDISNRLPKYAPGESAEASELEVRIGVVTEVRQADDFNQRFRFDTFLYKVQDSTSDAGAWRWLAANTTTGSVWNGTFLLSRDGATQAAIRSQTTPAGVAYGTHDPPILKEATVAIRVSTDNQACEIYDTVTGEILLSSRSPA